MNIARIMKCAISDGPGCRVSVYFSGCLADKIRIKGFKDKWCNCPGCHNKEVQDFNYGELYTEETKDYILSLCDHGYIAGITLCGGEPINQDISQLLSLVKEFKQRFPEKNIWCYTGYEYEDLIEGGRKYSPKVKEFLSYLDILVVGPFILELRDISNNNPWRGSTNQRVVDVKKSLQEGRRVLAEGVENNE